MNVAALVPYPLDRSPSQRFRLEQWAKPLRARGIELTFIPFLSEDAWRFLYKPGRHADKAAEILRGCFARARFALRDVADFDAVVIHREAILLGVDWIERMIVRRVPTVFDFDDAVWLPNVSPANRKLSFLKGFDKVNRILGLVSSVSAGCEFLAEHARKFNDRVFIAPTSIDLDQYREPRVHRKTDVLTVGWTGSVTSAEFLPECTPGLQLAAKHVPMRVVLLGTTGYEIPGVEVECIPWTPERETPVISTFDIGIKPSFRESWFRGKCPMKDIQYMALGVPPVATRFGTALESIKHGETGFLCDTPEDWLRSIRALTDVDLRTRMGSAARGVVEKRYSSVVAADAFARAIDSARTQFASGPARRSYF
jgi:hypothetical protein